jgi:hypothetical protein
MPLTCWGVLHSTSCASHCLTYSISCEAQQLFGIGRLMAKHVCFVHLLTQFVASCCSAMLSRAVPDGLQQGSSLPLLPWHNPEFHQMKRWEDATARYSNDCCMSGELRCETAGKADRCAA